MRLSQPSRHLTLQPNMFHRDQKKHIYHNQLRQFQHNTQRIIKALTHTGILKRQLTATNLNSTAHPAQLTTTRAFTQCQYRTTGTHKNNRNRGEGLGHNSPGAGLLGRIVGRTHRSYFPHNHTCSILNGRLHQQANRCFRLRQLRHQERLTRFRRNRQSRNGLQRSQRRQDT